MTYREINAIVMQCDAELSAAYAHGMATGMLCGNERAQDSEWLNELIRNPEMLDDEDKAMLLGLFEQTRDLLASEDYEFDLLLPGDNASLSEQVEALAQWCQGFLLGVGFSHVEAGSSRQVAEILKDIVEFTKLDTEAEGEEDENDFMEITEYIRSAVLLLQSELNANEG